MSPTSFPLVVGYEITRVIGSGGFSTVYEAIQDDIQSTVALKVLNVSIHDEAGARRLDREYRSMGRLRDQPGIVPVYGTSLTADGNAVIVMAYMSGGSLLDRIRSRGPLSAADAERLATELADALAAAHSVGIHHRDIKPENVLFDAYGHASLSDFGLATVEGLRDASQTAASLSPPHAPPERFTGASNPDPVAGDIYSLASTLHQSLTGVPPFGTTEQGGIVGLINRVCTEPTPSIERHDLPDSLRDAITVGLSKEPSDRPISAAEFRTLLDGVTAPASPVAPQPTATPTVTLPTTTSNETRVVEPHSAAPDDPTRTTPRRRLPWTILAVLLVLGGTFAALSRYAHSQYYVGFDGKKVSVYQGVPGGFVIWQPKVVSNSKVVERGDLTPAQELQVSRRVTYGSRGEAEASLRRLEERVFPTTTTTTSAGTSGPVSVRVGDEALTTAIPSEGLIAWGALPAGTSVLVDCRTEALTEYWYRMIDGPIAGQYINVFSTSDSALGLPPC